MIFIEKIIYSSNCDSDGLLRASVCQIIHVDIVFKIEFVLSVRQAHAHLFNVIYMLYRMNTFTNRPL